MRNKRFLVGFGSVVALLIGTLAFVSESTIEKKSLPALRNYKVHVELFTWNDSVRKRQIPVALYLPKKFTDSSQVKLVVFSHGYGANYSKNYTNYSYLTKRLAAAGYWVLSIQHELESDSLLPKTGNIQVVRRPFWQRGMENILFCINQFKQEFPEIIIESIDAVGHSNGGDMSVFTAQYYPELFRHVITLDHLRVALPRNGATHFTTLRSSDQQADPGVLPAQNTQQIEVIQLKKIGHNDMNDEGSRKQHKTINKFVLEGLRS